MKTIVTKFFLIVLVTLFVLPLHASALPMNIEKELTEEIEKVLYLPTDEDKEKEIYIPEVAVILTDWTSGEVIFSYNADVRVFPASTTKIMTALLACEAIESGIIKKTDEVAMTQSAIDPLPWDASSVYYPIEESEELTVEEYLYCTMLESDCRNCNILAEYISGNIESFAAKMTARARELGCTNTNFITPSGYHDDNHYTTARDMCLIASEAMHHPLFREIVGTKTYTVSDTNLRGERHLYSSNRLYGAMDVSGEGYYEGYGKSYLFDYSYEYACGIKTGTTSMAGSCLVSYAEKKELNQHLVCVVLGVTNRVVDGEKPELMQYVLTRDLFNAGFSELDRRLEEQKLAESIDLEPSPEDFYDNEINNDFANVAEKENISGENTKNGWIIPMACVIIATIVIVIVISLLRKWRRK